MQNKAIKEKYKVDYAWRKDFNNKLDPYKKPELSSYDLDALPITRTLRKDGNIQENWSLAAVGVYGRYYIYYSVIDKKTNRHIDWNFVYCDKNKIDLDDESTYKNCLRDTRLTREADGVYRIGVSRIFRNKYGYDINDNAPLKDDLKMIRDVLDKNNVCLHNKINIIRKIHVRSGGVRYMIKCTNRHF